ncbi:unnamed protein product [Closterium sp. NIES-54]
MESQAVSKEAAHHESLAAIERSQALAAEVVALEERVLRLRSNELKLERQAEGFQAEAEAQRGGGAGGAGAAVKVERAEAGATGGGVSGRGGGTTVSGVSGCHAILELLWQRCWRWRRRCFGCRPLNSSWRDGQRDFMRRRRHMRLTRRLLAIPTPCHSHAIHLPFTCHSHAIHMPFTCHFLAMPPPRHRRAASTFEAERKELRAAVDKLNEGEWVAVWSGAVWCGVVWCGVAWRGVV